MESSKFIILLCVIGAVKCLYSNIDPSAQIADTAILENYINVGPRVIIGPYAFFGSYATINQYSSVGRNSKIKSYVRIGEYTVIENDVTMNPYCTIGNRNTFKPGSFLYHNVMTADSVIIDKNAQLFPYSSIAYGVKIGEDVICDDYSLVGLYVNVHPKAYVGNYVIVQKDAVVSEFAVLQKYVEIPEGATVKPNQVVIRKPSSYEFYLTSDPVESIPDGMVKIATQGDSDTISPDFNKMLLQLIDSDLSKLSYDCKHSNFPNKPENLRRTISLYLIRYHGLNSYNENRQNLDDYNSDRVKQLQNELHLGPNPQKNILAADVQKNFIKLLAIVQDMDRGRRIADDTVCLMIAKILNEERDVTIADRSNKALYAPY